MGPYLDAAGQRHGRTEEPPRIVSLVPSITELLCALGLGPRLVGRTGFCIHPAPELKRVPKLGGTKDVDLAAVRRVAPTHVVVNVDENRRETAEALREFVPHLIVTHPNAPRDNLTLYRLLGGIFGREEAAARLGAELEAALGEATAGPARRRERVLYLIWRGPWMTVSRDTYCSRMLALFGWHTEPAAAAARYPEIALDDYVGRIDRVLLSSEPFPFRERHRAELAQRLGPTPVSLIDGEMTTWYGSRAILGLRYLARYTAAAEPARATG